MSLPLQLADTGSSAHGCRPVEQDGEPVEHGPRLVEHCRRPVSHRRGPVERFYVRTVHAYWRADR